MNSTGPKTPDGKASSSRNALKHGLLSAVSVLDGEDVEQFREFEASIRSALAPIGEMEDLLADRIVSAAWRLRRLIRTEVGLFESEGKTSGHALSPGLAFLREANKGDSFSKLSRYESGIERGMYRALAQLHRLQAARAGRAVPPPITLDLSIDLDAP